MEENNKDYKAKYQKKILPNGDLLKKQTVPKSV